jgi:conjugative transposon TraM protein
METRKKRMLLVMPLLVLPFLTLAFWAMGGGSVGAQGTKAFQQELNLNLPDARLKDDKAMDKMSFYEVAEQDSLKLFEQKRGDPYFSEKNPEAVPVSRDLSMPAVTGEAARPEDQLMQKLSLLQQKINEPEIKKQMPATREPREPAELTMQVDRLENMMQLMQGEGGPDPEMKQLDSTLEKILDIQHPERVREKLREKTVASKIESFPVTLSPNDTDEPYFWGLEETPVSRPRENAIEAVVHEAQTVVSGSLVKLRLLQDVSVNGAVIAKDDFVFGICALNGERLTIDIPSVRCGGSIYPVHLQVYDLDGLPGLYIPGAIIRDVAKTSADNSLSMMELSSLDPSIKAQAAAAGISTLKNFLSKKTKLVRITLQAGYKVLLQPSTY